ncbi:MAG: hypothetical protein OQJ89_08760 [Kangiellaceae bacterium]|nr:hypothetical protein [Kangiellaceae bacterium]
MNNASSNTITPGTYRYRPSQFLPWLNVQVFKESASDNDKLCIRFAGVALDAEKFIRRGQWKPV